MAARKKCAQLPLLRGTSAQKPWEPLPGNQVWGRCRREDLTWQPIQKTSLMPQPGLVSKWLRVGDSDDYNEWIIGTQKPELEKIKAAVVLCGERYDLVTRAHHRTALTGGLLLDLAGLQWR
jgi:hypothetical protein